MTFRVHFTDGSTTDLERNIDGPQVRMAVQSILRDMIPVNGHMFYAPSAVLKVEILTPEVVPVAEATRKERVRKRFKDRK